MMFIRHLEPGFETKVDLLPHFCTEGIGDYLIEVVTLLGRWVLEVRNDNGRYYLNGDTWTRFVNNHELEEGGLLTFDPLGSFFRFNVDVYESNRCQKVEFRPIK